MSGISELKVPFDSLVSPNLFADALLDLGLVELCHQLYRAAPVWLNDAHREAYDEGYDDGHDVGYDAGYDEDYDEGVEAGHKDGYRRGKEEAMDAADEDLVSMMAPSCNLDSPYLFSDALYDRGLVRLSRQLYQAATGWLDEARRVAFDEGYSSGHDDGYFDGQQDGAARGYEEGYSEGREAARGQRWK